MNPGKMDRRVTIQTRTLTKDTTGARVETWVDSFNVWAELVSNGSTEGVTADTDRETTDRQFRIRHKASLATGTHRLLYQLRFYDITGIAEEGRQDRMVLTCRTIQALTH